MRRVAIVGTGVAGLGCAYFLKDRYDLTLFEQDLRPGGHVCTVPVHGRPVDTGFMVFNHPTYPNLTRLFAELEVPTQPTDMSFGVQVLAEHLEWAGADWHQIFGQRRNLLRPRFWRMLLALDRFNKEGLAAVVRQDPDLDRLTLAEYVFRQGYGDDLWNWYLVPMSGAIWSTPPEALGAFPAGTLLRFFANHGFLGRTGQHPWYTVTGGARTYVDRLLAPLQKRLRLGEGIARLERQAFGVRLTTRLGSEETFDHVILACHPHQALAILGEGASARERQLLTPFRYQPNLGLLHTDTQVMPDRRACWASWNVRQGWNGQTSTHYWANKLQGHPDDRPIFVSFQADRLVRPEHVLAKLPFEHPLFTRETAQAQPELLRLNAQDPLRRVLFAGAYFRYGFHEDGFTAALEACRTLTGDPLWPGAPGLWADTPSNLGHPIGTTAHAVWVASDLSR